MCEPYRPHPAIPLSPPSPPAEGVKEGTKSHFSEYTPDSPSSPFMSVATKSYGQSFSETQASSVSAMAHRSPSPPTSTPMSTQVSQQPMTATTSFPTPDNSVIGRIRKAPDEFDEEHISKRQRIATEFTTIQDRSNQDLIHHLQSPASMSWSREIESQVSDQQPIAEGSHPIQSTRSSQVPDKTTQPAAVELSLEQLLKNVGETFHLCKSALPRVRPDPSQHLLSRYGLSGLHAKVARTDPVTHEKINKLRKSYEGQIKNFALAGRNKPTKDEVPEGQWSSLNMMMLEPEESWYASKVMGKKIEVTPELEARVHKAMVLQPGRMKNHEHWEDLLGHEKPRAPLVQEAAGKKAPSGAMQRPLINGNAVRSMSHAAGEGNRPRRTGKKRSYADNSFEGYGDGFVDDENVDLDPGTLSNSEDGSHGPGRKKRKKDHSLGNPATTYRGPSSYGVGGWNGGDR